MATAVVNGVLPPAPDVVNEIAEFEKILKLRDEIFSGKHPRLTVPAHVLRKVSPASQSTQLSSASSVPVQSQQSQIPPPQLPGLTLTEDGDQSRPHPATTTTSSGIDPVLLTKSDDLIKAETALQRQRLEKNLRDQFEQKRLDFRKKPAPAEAKPDFDIRAVLAKALDIVKPVALTQEQSEKEPDNDSFDENSFYSSRAPDSTPDRAARSSSEEGIEHGSHNNVPTTGGTQVATSSNKPPNPFSKDDAAAIDGDDEEDEEGEYSPPEPDQYPAQNGSSSSQAVVDPHNRPIRRYSDLDQSNKRPDSPSEQHMRIGRQHQNGRQRGRAESRSQSPETVQQRNKRRKIERKAEKRGKRGIKQENVSPPPFHDIQPLGAPKAAHIDHNEDRPIIIDDVPSQPQEVRYVPAPRYPDSPQRPLSRQPEYVPLSEPRVMSRAGMRPRDDQDLRRVASMHSMRIEQPREFVEYATPTRQRAASYMRVDSPMRDVGNGYASENDRQVQEIRVVRTPVPEYRDSYQPEPEIRYIPESMPPPTRERIIVDQYGRRFREIVQDPSPVSAMPREAPQYYDNYTPTRAGSVMIDNRPPQPRYEYDMPPPRMVRQSTQHSLQDSSPTHPPTMRDLYEPAPPQPTTRASSVAAYDRPPQSRQFVYADAGPDYRPAPRTASVRPEVPQYEDRPVLSAPRAGSVRPSQAREASIYIDDRSQVRREYVPMDQPRFRVMETENMPPPPPQVQTRYVDTSGREVMPPPQDGGNIRYIQRY